MFPPSSPVASLAVPSAAPRANSPGGSPQSVVIQLLHSVADPSWAPAPAADRLVRSVEDAKILRRARALLRVVTRHQVNRYHARAFATLSLAINRIEGTWPDPAGTPAPMTNGGRA